MSNLLSANLCSYGGVSDEAMAHLAALGVHHLEIGAPAPDGVEALRERMARFGLSAATLTTGSPIAHEDAAERFAPVAEAARALGASAIFISVRAGDLPRETAYARLRAMGDVAAANGVSIAMETHPDLCANGDQMLETMAAVDHPAVGINFDTANIYYYNAGADTVAEVRKAAKFVRAVHLKDSIGELESFNFPTLGQGIVDFPGVFAALAEVGFRGPYTMELEGVAGQPGTFEQRAQQVTDSVAYLRANGLV